MKGLSELLREKEAALESLETDGKLSVAAVERLEVGMFGVERALFGLDARERAAARAVEEHAEVLDGGLGCFEDVVRVLGDLREQVCLSDACHLSLVPS